MAEAPVIRYWAGPWPWSGSRDKSYFVEVEGPRVVSEIKTVASNPVAAAETLRLFCESLFLRSPFNSLFYKSLGGRVQLANEVPPNSGIYARPLSPQEEQQFLKALKVQ